jgi:hypothetical protein
MISTFFNPPKNGETFLSMDQLGALCETVAGRLQSRQENWRPIMAVSGP